MKGDQDPEEAEVLADSEAGVPGVAGRVVLLPVPAVHLGPEDGGRVVQLQQVRRSHGPRLADSEGDLLGSPVVEETEQTEGRSEETDEDDDSLAGRDGRPGQEDEETPGGEKLFVHFDSSVGTASFNWPGPFQNP